VTARELPDGVVPADTITKLPSQAAGTVVLCGSHGGRYCGYLAAKAGLRAIILCDAGVGRDHAGIGALAYLDAFGIPAATVSHLTSRIGDVVDMIERGRISHANGTASALGVDPGEEAVEAARRLTAAKFRAAKPESIGEARRILEGGLARRIVLVDSAALVEPDDAGSIVVTGSHGGLVGGDPAMALRCDGYAAVFNDAGIGIDSAGTARLPALETRGIAAFTVSTSSARIGEARSSFADGVISAVNGKAAAMGARIGASARAALLSWAAGQGAA
jgi:hypothetical protein